MFSYYSMPEATRASEVAVRLTGEGDLAHIIWEFLRRTNYVSGVRSSLHSEYDADQIIDDLTFHIKEIGFTTNSAELLSGLDTVAVAIENHPYVTSRGISRTIIRKILGTYLLDGVLTFSVEEVLVSISIEVFGQRISARFIADAGQFFLFNVYEPMPIEGIEQAFQIRLGDYGLPDVLIDQFITLVIERLGKFVI